MNIIVISHRRSGTHLTIDSIVNNFKIFKNIDFVSLEKYLKNGIEEFFEVIKLQKNNIIKTHFTSDFSNYDLTEKNIENLNVFFDKSIKIYVFRNGLDVMVSLFHYMQNYLPELQDITFSDFIKMPNDFEKNPEKLNRIDFWAKHIVEWQNSVFANNILFVKYEDWISDYSGTLNKISKHIGIDLDKKTNDIRIKSSINSKFINKYWYVIKKNFNKLLKNQKITSVSHRKGKINDYKNYFTDEDYKNISTEVWSLMKKNDYETFEN